MSRQPVRRIPEPGHLELVIAAFSAEDIHPAEVARLKRCLHAMRRSGRDPGFKAYLVRRKVRAALARPSAAVADFVFDLMGELK